MAGVNHRKISMIPLTTTATTQKTWTINYSEIISSVSGRVGLAGKIVLIGCYTQAAASDVPTAVIRQFSLIHSGAAGGVWQDEVIVGSTSPLTSQVYSSNTEYSQAIDSGGALAFRWTPSSTSSMRWAAFAEFWGTDDFSTT